MYIRNRNNKSPITSFTKVSENIFNDIKNNNYNTLNYDDLTNDEILQLKNYSHEKLNIFLISNKEIILDENSTIINTTTEEIKQEAAKYIANLRCREKTSISRGILKKLSAAKLHDLLNEVNKGLLNIEEEEISYKDFIALRTYAMTANALPSTPTKEYFSSNMISSS